MKNNLKVNDFVKNNSSTILTVVGSIGVCITAILSARDTVKAVKRIQAARDLNRIESVELDLVEKQFTTKEKIKIAAPCYIPTIISGLSTILCIVGANKLNKNTQKSLASAYILLDQSYKEYKKSVKEVYGKEGEEKIIECTANRKAEETSLPVLNNGDIFFDNFSLQFFESSLEAVKEAEKRANEILHSQGYVSLRTVYSLLGIDLLDTDNLLGWSINAGRLYDYDNIEFMVTSMPKESGKVQYVLDFADTPTEDYLYAL